MNKKYLFITLAIMAFIFVQSSLPGDVSGTESFFVLDILSKVFGFNISEDIHILARKIAHFTEYALLGGSLSLLVELKDNFKNGIWAFIIGAFYSVTDELHQYLVPERSCQIKDMLIDSAGVLFGVLVVMIAALISNGRAKKSCHNPKNKV